MKLLRSLLPGHLSASTWIVNPSHSRVLMLHHRKLDLWLHPGEHAGSSPDKLRVVMNEATEETVVAAENIRLKSDAIFDVDIQATTENTLPGSIISLLYRTCCQTPPRRESFSRTFFIQTC